MTYTGYIIKWREEKEDSTTLWSNSFVTGNITTTTIRGLTPNTTYVFGIAGLNEDQNDESWYNLDLYGRRTILDGALEGPLSSIIGHTLKHDIEFKKFDANSTQNHGPEIQSASIGPTGIESGEGHYGLVLVGHANVENCNASSFCCDSFDQDLGICMDQTGYVCVGTSSFETTRSSSSSSGTSSYYDNSNSNDMDTMLLPGNGKIVERYNESSSIKYFHNLFTSPCGPTLRLTASQSRQVGAAWYPRQVEVGEGFEANFTFRISNPSLR
jgi:hypothetical protein